MVYGSSETPSVRDKRSGREDFPIGEHQVCKMPIPAYVFGSKTHHGQKDHISAKLGGKTVKPHDEAIPGLDVTSLNGLPGTSSGNVRRYAAIYEVVDVVAFEQVSSQIVHPGVISKNVVVDEGGY